MMFSDYFEKVLDGVKFLLACGSVIGILTLILGIIGFIFSSSRFRLKMLGVIVFSMILLAFCGGPGRGIKYFRIH
jgi:uncharacterized membrane protein YfhO